MRAVRFHATGDVRVEPVPDPVPGPGEVLLEPLAVGVCGTDLHIVDGDYPASAPVVLGHEVAGRVVSPAGDLRVGDLVAVQPNVPCGECASCRLGREHLCSSRLAYGVNLDGGMAELMVVPARYAYRVPAQTDPSVAALTEPLACCVHAMDRLAPRSGLPLLVMGCGPAGALLVALARHLGLYPIVAADPRPDRRDLALRMGADSAVDPSALEPGFAYLIDAVGSAAVLETCVRLAAPGATVLVFGVAAPAAVLPVRPYEIYAKELTLLGTAVNPFTQSRAVELLGRLSLAGLRIATYPLARAIEAFAAARAGTADKVQLSR
jgi:threonine dehydrogenase-like Zn-dependent dehydrogenase